METTFSDVAQRASAYVRMIADGTVVFVQKRRPHTASDDVDRGAKGSRKHTTMVFIPIRPVTVTDPPRMSMKETMMLVARPNKWKTRLTRMPQQVAKVLRKMCALGLLAFILATSYVGFLWAGEERCPSQRWLQGMSHLI